MHADLAGGHGDCVGSSNQGGARERQGVLERHLMANFVGGTKVHVHGNTAIAKK
jgi:hypothetical protein